MDDRELRQEELLAMDSIYGHDGVFMADANTMAGVISMPIELEDSLSVKPAEPDKEPLTLRYLPPVRLEFSLPERYPSEEPPHIRVISNWLTPTQMIQVWRHLVTLWRQSQGNIVLFDYTEFMKSELMSFLRLERELDVSFFVERARTHAQQAAAAPRRQSTETAPVRPAEASRSCAEQLRTHYRLTLPATASIHQTLAAYQRQAELGAFQRARFVCKVCGDERLGADCVRLSQCGHVYCRACLTAFYTVLIRDGEVQNLRCPEEACPQQATPDEVRDLVGTDLFERYDTILLKTSLSSMTDVVTCPRLHCQKPVVLDGSDTLARCAHCEHTFCAICQNAYHGNNPCSIKTGERMRLLEQYRSGSEQERQNLEQRYGRRQLQKILEEVQSVDWMSSNSERCPRCRTPIEKIDGCNKMSCTKCGTLFCWLCNERLSGENPYLHFNKPGTRCFNNLFQGVVDLEDDEDMAFQELMDNMFEDDGVPMGFFL